MSLEQRTRSREIKSCCAATYSSDWLRLLVGDSMHPGGTELTQHLVSLLELRPESKVLDVAAGMGVSAVAVARTYGCQVTGIDLSSACIAAAWDEATRAGLAGRVSFDVADAESLPFEDCVFDAVLCECAFCTFPDKPGAAHEMARVLKPGGRLGLSDLAVRGELPADLKTLAAWVACIADARSESDYVALLESAGLLNQVTERHDDALARLVELIRGRLLTVRLLAGLNGFEIAGADLDQAAAMARTAESAVQDGILGYVLLSAVKPAQGD
jgi:ubiquinone/menaquinone biosynthesis C-methylase UbiE